MLYVIKEVNKNRIEKEGVSEKVRRELNNKKLLNKKIATLEILKEDYKRQVKELLEQNEYLKQEIMTMQNNNKEVAKSAVNRAMKLHNYIAERLGKEKIEGNIQDQWEFIDKFTKLVRVYIRTTEASTNKEVECENRIKKLKEEIINLLARKYKLIEEINKEEHIRESSKQGILINESILSEHKENFEKIV